MVELKFFGGLEANEIAEVLDVSAKTVLRDWNFAKLWLCRELTEDAAMPDERAERLAELVKSALEYGPERRAAFSIKNAEPTRRCARKSSRC